MSDDDQGAPNGGGAATKAADHQAEQQDDTSRAPDFSSIPPAEGFDTLSEFMAAVERLAALPEHEYDRVRIEEARVLRVRRGTLDKAVKTARPRDEEDEAKAGRKINIPQIEPWPDPVDGAELLTAMVVQLKRFIVASDAALDAVGLWILHTHAFEAWWISPKLLVKSATKRCGKTRVFETIERLVARRLLISLSTCSSVFRVIAAQGAAPPTLLMDEADKLTQNDDDMRKLINAGQSKSTASVMINVPCGDGWEPRQFSTWAPIALAGIGGQADTIQDRSVTVKMKRKPRARAVEKLRGNKDYGFSELARKCARWAADHVETLKDAEPDMPALLHDRAQDNWEPLIAIADAAGGDWPKRARTAALLLQQAVEATDEDEVAVQLLHDIDAVFELAGAPEITTAVLLIRLHEMEERLWATYGRSETPLKGHQLSAMLREFEVRSKQIWIEIDGKTVNRHGYERAQFTHLLAQYPNHPARPLDPAETQESYANAGSAPAEPPVRVNMAAGLGSSGLAAPNGVWAEGDDSSRSERFCIGCGEPLPVFSKGNREYCSDACRMRMNRITKGSKAGAKANSPEPGLYEASGMPSMITRAMRAKLRERGVHPDVIAELRPGDAHRMLDAPETVCANATRSPEHDLRELAAAVADQDSRHLASEASRFANAVEITADDVDAIKAGNMVLFAVRDALWAALA